VDRLARSYNSVRAGHLLAVLRRSVSHAIPQALKRRQVTLVIVGSPSAGNV
jgi:hypothetical protein